MLTAGAGAGAGGGQADFIEQFDAQLAQLEAGLNL